MTMDNEWNEELTEHEIKQALERYFWEVQLCRGTQVVYIPTHAHGDPKHPDAEVGFITSLGKDGHAVFCRYWSKFSPDELRTKANSEATPIILLDRPASSQLR